MNAVIIVLPSSSFISPITFSFSPTGRGQSGIQPEVSNLVGTSSVDQRICVHIAELKIFKLWFQINVVEFIHYDFTEI